MCHLLSSRDALKGPVHAEANELGGVHVVGRREHEGHKRRAIGVENKPSNPPIARHISWKQMLQQCGRTGELEFSEEVSLASYIATGAPVAPGRDAEAVLVGLDHEAAQGHCAGRAGYRRVTGM
eukprot:1161958-Pelagomonas_calceolata.AAC.3